MNNKILCHFLDSGAHSLKNRAEEGKLNKKKFYHSKEFWTYIDDYAKFIKSYKEIIHFYANLDVIKDPDLTWRNQKYLEEKHNLKPVPVIHFGTDMKWLRFYMERYDFIALGGLSIHTRHHSRKWLDECFTILCDTPDRFPKIKVHGFAVTSFKWLTRYPWWSVDSTSWLRTAALGKIYVPRKKSGEWCFGIAPFVVNISDENPSLKDGSGHFESFSKQEKEHILSWLEMIDVPLGTPEQRGVRNHSEVRRRANIFYLDGLMKYLTKNPKPFQVPVKKGLVL